MSDLNARSKALFAIAGLTSGSAVLPARIPAGTVEGPLETFGSNVFDDKAMRRHLPRAVYRSLRKTMDRGERLDPEVADVVANAMKDWAMERGATHIL